MSCFEFVKQKLSGQDDPYQNPFSVFFVKDVFVTFSEIITSSEVIINELETVPTGTGIGTQVVKAIKEFAEQKGLQLRFRDVTAVDFFDRFHWLTPVLTGEETEGRQVIDYLYLAAA